MVVWLVSWLVGWVVGWQVGSYQAGLLACLLGFGLDQLGRLLRHNLPIQVSQVESGLVGWLVWVEPGWVVRFETNRQSESSGVWLVVWLVG